MNTTNISDMTDTQIDRLLGMVDEAPAAPTTGEHELTAAEKELVKRTLEREYYKARADGKGVDEAKEIGLAAVRGLFAARSAAFAPATAAPAPSTTPSGRTEPATSGSAHSTGSSPDFTEADEQFAQANADLARAIMNAQVDVDACGASAEARANGPALEGEASKTNHHTHDESIAQGVDKHGLARSERDVAALVAAGFAPKDTVYTRGLRVIQAGVDAAHESRVEFEAKPLVVDMCTDVETKILREAREDLTVTAASVQMDGLTGALKFEPDEHAQRHLVHATPGAFRAMCGRMGYGGAQYLAEKCPTMLRARNVNEQHLLVADAEATEWNAWNASGRKGKEPQPRKLVLRTRGNARTGRREVFSVVTPGYTPFDADKVAQAIREATPAGARGTVTYDGARARFEVLFQSTVQPKHYVAGEVFRAGAVVTTDDTGGGSIRGSNVAWQNLCLNLAIIDTMAVDAFVLRHIGSVEQLAKKFREEFGKALDRIGHFIRAWDYACEDDVIAAAAAISDHAVPADRAEALRGLFRGLISGGPRARVHLPKSRKIEEHVDALLAAWESDDSSATQVHRVSRAAIVNAFTRYAHTVELDDPFADDEIQRQASALLWAPRGAKAPRALEYVALESATVEDTAKA